MKLLMIYISYLCPISFFPWIHFPPGFILPLYHFDPWKLLNDLHYLPMSQIISPPPPDSFCPHIILPPENRLMIYTIYPCPISFFPLDSFCPHIILNPPLLFCLLEIVYWFTLFTHDPYHFAP